MPKRLGEILVEAGLIDGAQLSVALREQARWGGQLGRILIGMSLVGEEELVQALSRQLGVPAVDLRQAEVSDEDLDLVDDDFAVEHQLVPLRRVDDQLHVAMSDPSNLGVLEELSLRARLEVQAYIAGPLAIEEALARYYGRGAGALDLTLGSAGGGFHPEPEPPSEASGTILTDQSASASGSHPLPRRRRRTSQYPPRSPGVGGSPISEALELLRREVAALQQRVRRLESLLHRDEEVIRKLLGLLVDKGLATRDEVLERIK